MGRDEIVRGLRDWQHECRERAMRCKMDYNAAVQERGHELDRQADLLNDAAVAIRHPLNTLADHCHTLNAKWWTDPVSGKRVVRNKAELICLMHSELSEALEGVRKGLPDSHLPHRSAEEVEFADSLIRHFDYAGAFGLDLDGAVEEKNAYNVTRADHSLESRAAPGGKKF